MLRRTLYRLTPVPPSQVRVEDGFWGPRLETNRTVTLPTEFRQNRRTGALRGYQWEWDPAAPQPAWRIWMGDVTKWIEAAAWVLQTRPDPRLRRMAAEAVDQVCRGQKPDGYLYANPMAPDRRWTNLRDLHELYDAGHAMEAAVAWWEATGERRFLDAVCRCADLLVATFGRRPGQRRGYDGHPEVELALVRLWRATGRQRYLDLARFFVDERGRRPYCFDREAAARGEPVARRRRRVWAGQPPYAIYQAHAPVRRQADAVGHAVRALYLYSGMSEVADATGDRRLMAACRRLWRSVVRRRMYVIGGVGSTRDGEAFTFDYDLPNDTAYAETCANIALVLFGRRMLQLGPDREYADVVERALYNGVLSGVSLEGQRFFYANHLAVFPPALAGAPAHTAAVRQPWFGCACCPPNLARMLAQVPGCIYATGADGVWVHLYVQGEAEVRLGGQAVRLRQHTQYPWDGKVLLEVHPQRPASWTLGLRLPGWCREVGLRVNGDRVDPEAVTRRGYARIRRRWQPGDRVELRLAMPPERIEAHPGVRQNAGRIALQRGPLVYCLEEVDNGRHLDAIALPRSARLRVRRARLPWGEAPVITARATRCPSSGWDDTLYRAASTRRALAPVTVQAIPYCMWGNRRPGEMLVWIREA